MVSDAIPGTTLTLTSGGGPPETLSIGYDAAGTQANLQKFVDAYNGIMSAIQRQLNVAPNTDRQTTLAGDINVRSLQEKLQAITSSIAYGQGTVHSLADLGVKTNRDGTLAIDPSGLSSAMARDPVAVNALFAQATTGVAQRLWNIAIDYSSVTGLLSAEQTSLKRRVSDMDDQAAQIQARIDAYHAQLVAQYAAMENIVSRFKSIGDFLTAQEDANNKK
jgi:flagellar hook-associated protein 2